MRVLIYSETEEANELLTTLREAGDKASLRNPHLFDAREVELCDKVYCHVADSEIVAAYVSKGIGYNWIDNEIHEEETDAETEAEVKPKSNGTKRK